MAENQRPMSALHAVVLLLLLTSDVVLVIRFLRDLVHCVYFGCQASWPSTDIVLTHLNLIGLYYVTRRYEVSPSGSMRRTRAKLWVFVLGTTFTVSLMCKIGSVLQSWLATFVCMMICFTVVLLTKFFILSVE